MSIIRSANRYRGVEDDDDPMAQSVTKKKKRFARDEYGNRVEIDCTFVDTFVGLKNRQFRNILDEKEWTVYNSLKITNYAWNYDWLKKLTTIV